MVKLHRQDLFPTPIWHFELENSDSLNQKLLSKIDKQQQTDPGFNISNRLGWHSTDNLQTMEPFRELLASVNDRVMEIARTVSWDFSKAVPIVNNCWANVNSKHGYNKVHNHPSSILSGVYYVQTPEQCGGIFFYDPRIGRHMLNHPMAKSTPWTAEQTTYKPKAGMMVIFPSWLWHGVEPNMNEEPRISIAFNIGYKKV